MKKLLVIICFLGGMFSFTNAQAFNGSRDQKLQLGINAYGYGTGITGSYEHGVNDWLSLGAGAEFYWEGDDDFFIYGKVNFHLGELIGMPRNMDLYPGINIGGRSDGFGIDGHVGYRYFFNNKFGVFGELGSHGALGVTFNL